MTEEKADKVKRPFGSSARGRTMEGLVAGLVQAAARHVGAGIAARAAYHASVRVEAERLARPLAPGDGKGAAAAQPDLVLGPAAELVEAVSLDARALSYAMPEKRAKKKDRRGSSSGAVVQRLQGGMRRRKRRRALRRGRRPRKRSSRRARLRPRRRRWRTTRPRRLAMGGR